MSTRQRNIALLLARDLANTISTPCFIVDADGALVFYNEHAERLVGRSFAEVGPMRPEQWGLEGEPESEDGRRLGLEDLPLMVALQQGRPAHERMSVTTFAGERIRLAVTAFPLLSGADEPVGAAALFWPEDAAED